MKYDTQKTLVHFALYLLKICGVVVFHIVLYSCRFNEDCQYPHCGYREHQTHFHCMRKDCGYSFCDKTRFVQHTARHERLDTLMGGDFNQFRSNISCGRPDCVYASMIGESLFITSQHYLVCIRTLPKMLCKIFLK